MYIDFTVLLSLAQTVNLEAKANVRRVLELLTAPKPKDEIQKHKFKGNVDNRSSKKAEQTQTYDMKP